MTVIVASLLAALALRPSYRATSAPVPAPTASATASLQPWPTVLMFGDSVMAGSGRETGFEPRAADIASADLGWRASIQGFPGTGYIRPYKTRRPFPEALRNVIGGTKFDVVVIEGSSNDYHTSPKDHQLSDAITQVIATVRHTQPQAFIVLLGPYAPSHYKYDQELRVLRQVASKQHVAFIDPVQRKWMVGVPKYMSPDGYHANGAGQIYLGHLWAAAFKEVIPANLIGPSPAP
jgi:acyl-CoA thioesterase-1